MEVSYAASQRIAQFRELVSTVEMTHSGPRPEERRRLSSHVPHISRVAPPDQMQARQTRLRLCIRARVSR